MKMEQYKAAFKWQKQVKEILHLHVSLMGFLFSLGTLNVCNVPMAIVLALPSFFFPWPKKARQGIIFF